MQGKREIFYRGVKQRQVLLAGEPNSNRPRRGLSRPSGEAFFGKNSLLKPREDLYRGKRLMAADALLVAEVSDTTLAYDRDVKPPPYAAAQIPEVWIE